MLHSHHEDLIEHLHEVLMLKSTTQGLWSARGEDIIDKSVAGLLCCRAVQENRYTETVRMQSQPLASNMKADTTWTLM